MPVVGRNARDDVVVVVVPAGAEVCIFNPHVLGGRLGTVGYQAVLREDGGLEFHTLLYDVALVLDEVLNGHAGVDHVGAGAVVVELAAGQGEHGHLQVGQVGIGL